jgi:hypothetical protein
LDYAGLFPPAALGMEEAVDNYARYRGGEFAWILGRFILPVSRLEEFETALGRFRPETQKGEIWRLSVLGTNDSEADLKQILEFNRRNSGGIGSRVAVADTIELKAGNEEAIRRADRVFSGHLQTYFEIAISRDTPHLLRAISEQNGRAKVRTGGLAQDLFPAPEQLANFIFLCAGAAVPFKATAGLHHAIRSTHPLTYEKAGPLGIMHGFLNLLFAAALAHAGADEENVRTVLSQEDPKTFHFDDGSVRWSKWTLDNRQLRHMRERFFQSFGACSFLEPTAEMREMKLL